MEESSKNYMEYHEHPLLLVSNREQLLISNQRTRVLPECSRCGQKVSTPCFRCEEDDCGFYLDKLCADAPLELNHPFHLDHPLRLSRKPPGYPCCYFCGYMLEKLGYICSCGLLLHIKCALFTLNIAQNNFKDLEHVVLEDPFVPTQNDYHGLCIGCREPLVSSTYFSSDCGYKLHKKCVEHPHKLNHKCHRKHPLVLQFNNGVPDCKMCQAINYNRFVYVCSPCELAIHIECLSPSPTIEHETHPHPFNLFWRQGSFICDACGTEGDHVAYTCGTCSILVHKECISLPRFIKSKWHDHRVSHTYSLHREYFTTLDCIICHDEVNTEHGSYCCKFCNVIFHTSCALKDEDMYDIVSDDEESLDESANSFAVLERNDAGEAAVIEHCEHIGHHLMLTDRVSGNDDKCCDGCLLPISASFYYCSQCDFVLHKVCAELPKEKQVWYHRCRQPLVLTSNEGFTCVKCDCASNAFFYMCKECEHYSCLRCTIALTPGARTHPGHKHPLFFYPEYKAKCSACGLDDIKGLLHCKDCYFCLHHKCFSLPITARHKCDEHRLSLTYHDNNNYSKSHFCDNCEEGRNPNPWFYHCATCDTSVHVSCVIDRERAFIKIGSSVDVGGYHPHPLTCVKKSYYYPNCSRCGEPCVDLSLECGEPGCNYIIHFGCPK